ncbi:MAG TPA: hypothetical protein VH372_22370 [Actinospica sp.]|jgi:hypothetical protein|nr:hypothetical protein [Actinospica sp.]
MVTEDTQYRIERLRHRLAQDEPGELGLRIEARGEAVAVSGTVPDAECRASILQLIAEELDGLTVYADITAAQTSASPSPEEL